MEEQDLATYMPPSFWGLEVKAGGEKKSTPCEAEQGFTVQLSNAALGEDAKDCERVTLWIENNGEKFVLCTLCKATCDQYAISGGVVFNELDEVRFWHTGSKVSVHLTGYCTFESSPFDSDDDDDDDDLDDVDSGDGEESSEEDSEEGDEPALTVVPGSKVLKKVKKEVKKQVNPVGDEDSDENDSGDDEPPSKAKGTAFGMSKGSMKFAPGEKVDADDNSEEGDSVGDESEEDDAPTPNRLGKKLILGVDNDSDPDSDSLDSEEDDDDEEEEEEEEPQVIKATYEPQMGIKRKGGGDSSAPKVAKHFDGKDNAGRGGGGRGTPGRSSRGSVPGGRGSTPGRSGGRGFFPDGERGGVYGSTPRRGGGSFRGGGRSGGRASGHGVRGRGRH